MSNCSNIVVYVHENHKEILLKLLGNPDQDYSEGQAFGGFWNNMPWGSLSTIEELTRQKIPHLYWTGEGEYGAWGEYTRAFDGKDGWEVPGQEGGFMMAVPDKEIVCGDLWGVVEFHNGFIRTKDRLMEEWGLTDFFGSSE